MKNIANLSNDFNIPTDILTLLFIKDQSISAEILSEPSLIDRSLPISNTKNIKVINSPGYYPSYRNLTPEQRWVYLKFLEHPYKKIDIGYVFIFYYGLERYLLTNKYKEAFNVIIKLRNVHDNKSFQTYSLRALFATCIINNDDELLNYLLNNSDLSSENTNITLAIKALSNQGLTCNDLINSAKFFNFTNHRYIKNDYSCFYIALQEVLLKHYRNHTMPLNKYLSDIKSTVRVLAFANTSIKNRTCLIPDFASNEMFIQTGYTLLSEAHNIVKAKKIKKTF